MNAIDVLLVVFILGYFVWGVTSGFLASLGALIGFVSGTIGAFLLLPSLVEWTQNPMVHITLLFLIVTLLNLLGNWVGFRIGQLLKLVLKFPVMHVIDKILGGVTSLLVVLVGLPLLAFSVISLGIPNVSQALDSSRVINTLNNMLPDELKSKALSIINNPVTENFPKIPEEWFSKASVSPLPEGYEETAEQKTAGDSVVKITGVAYQCNRTQLGSGVVIAPDRVMTNAHVVAGLRQVVVSGRGKGQHIGEVVYFDAQKDIAVVATQKLPLKALELADSSDLQQQVVFDGYPRGGPFTVRPAIIDGQRQVTSPNIYGDNPQALHVTQLAAHVEQGNSGGPALDKQGKIVALIYARAMDNSPVGYAIAREELRPVVEDSLNYTESIDTGHCSQKTGD